MDKQRVNQVLEDMLQMYVRDHPKKWEECLHLVEFAYNNHYQASIKLSHFEILYGRKCNIVISWSNLVDRLMLGLDLLKEMKITVKQEQRNLKITKEKQKSHAKLKRTQK